MLVNSLLDERGQVAAFEELIGCHGGTGGLQTDPLLIYPASWTSPESTLVGAESVHAFLSRQIGLSGAEAGASGAEEPAVTRDADAG